MILIKVVKVKKIIDALLNWVRDNYNEKFGIVGFEALNQTYREWRSVDVAPDGSIYATVNGGDIYKSSDGGATFVALNQTIRNWYGIAVASNGDVFATVCNGFIYKQTGGTGDFEVYEETERDWFSICVTSKGDIYATVNGGDIYKQTGMVGDFVALNQGDRTWNGITGTPDGSVYAAVNGGFIYKQTGGTGDFVAVTTENKGWRGMSSNPNGDVFAAILNNKIYKQTKGVGDFEELDTEVKFWEDIAVTATGEAYAVARSEDIYKSVGAVTDSFLYKVLHENTDGDYNFYEQAKEIFLHEETSPRKIKTSLMFNSDTNGSPHIHVREAARINGSFNGIGGINAVEFVNVNNSIGEEYRDTKRGVYEIIVTASNPLETVMVGEVVYSLLLAAYETLNDYFDLFDMSMKEMMYEGGNANRLFAKVITLSTQEENHVPSIISSDAVNQINFVLQSINGEELI